MNNLCLNFTGQRSDLAGRLMSGILFESDTFRIYTTSTTSDNHFLVYSNTNAFTRISNDDIGFLISTDSIFIYPDTSVLEFGFLISQVFTESDSGNLQVLFRFLEPVTVVIDTNVLYSANLLLETDVPFDLFKSARVHWNNFQYAIGIDDIKSNVSEFSLDPIVSVWQANRTVTIQGEGFDNIHDIVVDNQSLYFELVDEFELELHLPELFNDTIVLRFDTYMGNYYSDPIEILPAWKSTSLRKYVNVLYEDDSVLALVKWSEIDYPGSMDFILHLSMVDTSTNAVVGVRVDSLQDLYLKIYENLSNDSTYLVELYQWDDYYSDYILVDYVFFNANNDGGNNDQMVVSQDIMAHLGGWGEVADTVTYVEYVQGFDLHPIELRSFLQAINGGKGFSISEYPWYSNHGPIYSRGPSVSPPNFPEEDPDGGDPGPGPQAPCLCKLFINTYYADEWDKQTHFTKGLNDYSGWYLPSLSMRQYGKWNSSNRIVIREDQKKGASVYRNFITFRKNYDIVQQTLNYSSNNSNSANNKATNGTISIVYDCWQNPNANQSTPRCTFEQCIIPSVFNYSYCTSIRTPQPKMYHSLLTSIAKSIILDGVFVGHKSEDAAPINLIDGKLFSQQVFCEEGVNPAWWRAFAGFLAGFVPILDFSDGGVSIDLENLTETQVNSILNKLIDLFTISYKTKNHNNCSSDELNDCIEDPFAHSKSFPFDLVPYKKIMFVVASTQSAFHRALRAKVVSEIKSDFHMSVLIGRDIYGGPESPIETCCVNRRGAYVVGSQVHRHWLWLGKDAYTPNYFENGNWPRTFGALVTLLNDYYAGQLPSLGFNYYHTLNEWIDLEFCDRYGIPSSTIWGSDTIPIQELISEHSKVVNRSDIPLFIYPNPSSHKVYLQNDSDESIKSISFYDLSGRLINLSHLSFGRSDRLLEIDVSDFPPGFFIIEIELNDSSVRIPFVKQ